MRSVRSYHAAQPHPPAVGEGEATLVEGSSERMLLTDGSLDLILTDPPYHDDV